MSGIDKMEFLQKNAKVAADFKPLASQEMAELEKRCSPKKEYEGYRRWAYRDGQSLGAQLLLKQRWGYFSCGPTASRQIA